MREQVDARNLAQYSVTQFLDHYPERQGEPDEMCERANQITRVLMGRTTVMGTDSSHPHHDTTAKLLQQNAGLLEELTSNDHESKKNQLMIGAALRASIEQQRTTQTLLLIQHQKREREQQERDRIMRLQVELAEKAFAEYNASRKEKDASAKHADAETQKKIKEIYEKDKVAREQSAHMLRLAERMERMETSNPRETNMIPGIVMAAVTGVIAGRFLQKDRNDRK